MDNKLPAKTAKVMSLKNLYVYRSYAGILSILFTSLECFSLFSTNAMHQLLALRHINILAILNSFCNKNLLYRDTISYHITTQYLDTR